MNIIIGAIGANLTLGVLTGATSVINNVYSITKTLSNSTSTHADEVKQILKETDLEVRVKTIQLLIDELVNDIKLNEQNESVRFCIIKINEATKDIYDELEKINFRLQYNDSLRYGSFYRAYKFDNCKQRLFEKIKILESRYESLSKISLIKKNFNVINANQLTYTQDAIKFDENNYDKIKLIEHIDN